MECQTGRDIIARSCRNPLISMEDLPFRAGDIWNAAVVRFQGKYLMLLTVEELEGHYSIYRADSDDGEEFTIDSEFEVKRPLSVDLFYEIDTWCHDSQTSLAMDLALQATFPERGVLNLPIDANNVAFPVELLGIQDLDDLTENIREKVYRYKVEAWIPSYLTDTTRKIITTPIEEFFKTTGNEAEGDLGESLGQVELAPDA